MINFSSDKTVCALLALNSSLQIVNNNTSFYCINKSLEAARLPSKNKANVAAVITELDARVQEVKKSQKELTIEVSKWSEIKENILAFAARSKLSKSSSEILQKICADIDEMRGVFYKVKPALAKPLNQLTQVDIIHLQEVCEEIINEKTVIRNIVCSSAAMVLKYHLFNLFHLAHGSMKTTSRIDNLYTVTFDWKSLTDLSEEETIISLTLQNALFTGYEEEMRRALANILKENKKFDPKTLHTIKLWVLHYGQTFLSFLQDFTAYQPITEFARKPDSIRFLTGSAEPIVNHYLQSNPEFVSKSTNPTKINAYFDKLITYVKTYESSEIMKYLEDMYFQCALKLFQFFTTYSEDIEKKDDTFFKECKDKYQYLVRPDVFRKYSLPSVTSKELISSFFDNVEQKFEGACLFGLKPMYGYFRSLVYRNSENVEFELYQGYSEFERCCQEQNASIPDENHESKKIFFGKHTDATYQQYSNKNLKLSAEDKAISTKEKITRKASCVLHKENTAESLEQQMSSLRLGEESNALHTKSINELVKELESPRELSVGSSKKKKSKKVQALSSNAIAKEQFKGTLQERDSGSDEDRHEKNLEVAEILKDYHTDKGEIDKEPLRDLFEDEWRVITNKANTLQFTPASLSDYLNEVKLDERVMKFFSRPDIALEEERFKDLSDSVKDKIKVFKQYPGIISYYLLTRGIKGRVVSKTHDKKHTCWFAIGSISQYDSDGKVLVRYKGTFTDAYDAKNPKKLFHHCFTQKKYGDILHDYVAKGYMEVENEEEKNLGQYEIEDDSGFKADAQRFIITEIPYGIIVNDTVKRILYKVCFPSQIQQ